MDASREMVVFAAPAIQNAVAECIASYEKNAMLFDRIDLQKTDPREVGLAIERAVRRETEKNRESFLPDDRIEYRFGPLAKKLLVRGTESQIDSVRNIVTNLAERSGVERQLRSTSETDSTNDATVLAEQKESNQSPSGRRFGKKSIANKRFTEPTMLLVPRRPVKIVHVKGLDLLLIRGSGGSVRKQVPVLSGNTSQGRLPGTDQSQLGSGGDSVE
jgi:hypothetical protein